MFCSSCGRTLLPGETQCRHCGAPVADSVFTGIPYTSAQKRLTPGDTPYAGERVFTKITYDEPEAAPAAEAEAAKETVAAAEPAEAPATETPEAETPAAEPAEAPAETAAEAVPQTDDIHTGAESADQELREGEKEIDDFVEQMDELRARPIVSKGQEGISADISEYVEKMTAAKTRRANRRKKGKRSEGEEAEEPRETEAVRPAAEPRVAPAEPEDFEEEEDEDEAGYEARPRLSAGQLQALKIAGLILVLIALVVGIVFWVRHVRESSKTSPIDGVSIELYNSGIQMISDHADSDYTKSLLETYSRDGILTLTQKLDADANAIAALTPAEASIGDSEFVSALKSIQSNIGNAVTMDALAIAQPTDDSKAASQARWRVVSDSIVQLKAARSTSQLEAIINGERINIQTVAPTATPVPTKYNTLTRGDKNEEVRKMQERLWELGYLQDVRDGAFGGNTYTAVKAFQQAAGLDVTGIADSRTLNALYAEDAPRTANAQPTENTGN